MVEDWCETRTVENMLLFYNKELRRTPCTFEKLGIMPTVVAKMRKLGILERSREHAGTRNPIVLFYVAEKYRDRL